jgi:formate dehydrogenase iron-sulfur subunit
MPAAPTEIAVHRRGGDAQRMGFFTDTTVCIGCKACEVACKQWNDLPADGLRLGKGSSYDYTGRLSAASWRHVRFVETVTPTQAERDSAVARVAQEGGQLPSLAAAGTERGEPSGGIWDLPGLAGVRDDGHAGAELTGSGPIQLDAGGLDRWVFMSDVCKHCTHAGCLDACPTGALIRTEFETVIVQADICNGCGYCVPSCPFGVIDRDPYDGRAAKCTLCYDRLQDGLEPACAKACPTDSIQFGPYEELVEVARGRVAELQGRGMQGAYLYGAGDEPGEQLAGGLGAFFLLTEPPESFGLPARAQSPSQENAPIATLTGLAAAATGLAAAVASFVWSSRR